MRKGRRKGEKEEKDEEVDEDNMVFPPGPNDDLSTKRQGREGKIKKIYVHPGAK
jgi:hypothetical protein